MFVLFVENIFRRLGSVEMFSCVNEYLYCFELMGAKMQLY